MKIAKKLTVGLVGIIVVVFAITFISAKYEQKQNEVDQFIALECDGGTATIVESGKQVRFPEQYYILRSSKKSRSEDDYYKNAITVKTDFHWYEVDEPLPEMDWYVEGEYQVIRTANYTHLFKHLADALEFIKKQEKLPPHKDAYAQGLPVNPTASFNRATLETVFYNYIEQELTSRQCKEVTLDVPYRLAEETQKRAVKKIL